MVELFYVFTFLGSVDILSKSADFKPVNLTQIQSPAYPPNNCEDSHASSFNMLVSVISDLPERFTEMQLATYICINSDV